MYPEMSAIFILRKAFALWIAFYKTELMSDYKTFLLVEFQKRFG